MDIRQLRYFVAIVEQGSFSRAANFLRIAQPALSLHVRNMEADLGATLLFRNPKGVMPTEAGTILLRNARIILDQFSIAEEEIRGHENDPSGEVRLGLPGTISQILAVPLITAVHQRFPKIKLRISEAMSGFVLEWMRAGRIDLAVLYDEPDENGIHSTRLLEEKLALFGPAEGAMSESLSDSGSSVPFQQVVALRLILPGEGHGLRHLLARSARSSELALKTVIDVDSYSNIKALVAEGFGYSILPEHAIAREVAEGQLRSWSIRDPDIRRSVYLCHAVDRPITNAVASVLRLARETLLELVQDQRWIGAETVAATDDESSEPDPSKSRATMERRETACRPEQLD